jgi:DinB superfamily
MSASRPLPDEYNPYYERYISLVDSADICAAIEQQGAGTAALLKGIGEERGAFRYAPDKWSIKQVLGHVIDSERIFSYRALRIARGDQTPMEGFEQDDYIRNGPFDQCAMAGLIEEFEAVRQSTVRLFRHLQNDAWTRRGVANQNEVTVRALAWIIAGHELHHRAILRERYLL